MKLKYYLFELEYSYSHLSPTHWENIIEYLHHIGIILNIRDVEVNIVSLNHRLQAYLRPRLY